MFDLNTKIILVASSCHKKVGPRKNSIGYIVTINKSLTVLSNPNVVVISANIKFLHYGNEKKDRFETKRVLLVFPILQDNQDSIDNQFERFAHTINSNRHVEYWNKVRHFLKETNNTPVVIAIPLSTPEVNFELCSSQEFFCWFEGFLMSRQINSFVNKALISNHFSQNELYNVHTLLALQSMMVNKSIRQNSLSVIYRDKLKRKKWINILRIITITREIHDQKNIIASLHYTSNNILQHIKDNRKSVAINKIYAMLIPYVFCRFFSKFTNIIMLLKGTDKSNKEISKIVDRIESTKAMILEL